MLHEKQDMVKRLAAAEDKSKALDKALNIEREKNVKLRQDGKDRQDELMEGLSDIRSDMASSCAQK